MMLPDLPPALSMLIPEVTLRGPGAVTAAAAGVGLTAAACFWWLASTVTSRRRQIAARIDDVVTAAGTDRVPAAPGEEPDPQPDAAVDSETDGDGAERGSDDEGGPLSRRLAAFEKRLVRADIPLRAHEFLGAGALGGVVLAAGAYAATGLLLLGLPFVAFGGVIPWLILMRAEARRQAQFGRQIPDTLLTLSNALKAGHGFLGAAGIVSREMPAPMGNEFRRMLREISMGVPTEQALEAMNRRVDNEDLDLVVTAVLIQRQIGGNLAEVLDSILETIRERIRIKGEIQTMTAQGRLSAVIVLVLPVAIGAFIMAVNPGFIGIMFENVIGWAMIGLAIMLEIIGGILIKNIVDIEV